YSPHRHTLIQGFDRAGRGAYSRRLAEHHNACRFDEMGGTPPVPTEGEMTRGSNEIYYDPYDFQIDDNPYPVWKRMRDEMPLYRNERYDFFAVSRFDDVET